MYTHTHTNKKTTLVLTQMQNVLVLYICRREFIIYPSCDLLDGFIMCKIIILFATNLLSTMILRKQMRGSLDFLMFYLKSFCKQEFHLGTSIKYEIF